MSTPRLPVPIESGLEVRQEDYSIPEHVKPEGHLEPYTQDSSTHPPTPRSSEPMRSEYGSPYTSDVKHPMHQMQEEGGSTRRKRSSPWLLGTIVALVTAVIVGGAVGGGLGGVLAPRSKALATCTSASSPLTTATATAGSTTSAPSTVTVTAPASTTTGGLLTNYLAPSPSAIASVPLDCPALDGQAYVTLRTDSFTLSCSKGLNGGDWSYMVAYHYTDCLEACSSMNWFSGGQRRCTAVQFSAMLRWRRAMGATVG